MPDGLWELVSPTARWHGLSRSGRRPACTRQPDRLHPVAAYAAQFASVGELLARNTRAPVG